VTAAAVGLCGLGSAALRAHLPALSRAEETGAAVIAGVCDPDRERRERVIERTRRARAYPDVEALLEGSGCDLLVIASPPSAHLPAIEAAARRGIDVLCEKPLGVGDGDVDELRRLTAEAPGWLVATVHQYAHAPAWRVIERCLRLPAVVDATFRLEVEVERPGTDPLSAGGWRAHGDREGGILGDHAVHYLALCHRLDPGARVLEARREGEPGRESAAVELAVGAGEARIAVSYAGQRRRNLVALDLPDLGAVLRWEDGALWVERCGTPGRSHRTGALSDRQFVNDLYGALYDDLLGHRDDPGWRDVQRRETVEVAALLGTALGLTHQGRPPSRPGDGHRTGRSGRTIGG
jgi:predicted dehydrogenase